jgi:hypothetical protein
MGVSETVSRLFATGSSAASTWKLSRHVPTLSLERMRLSLDPTYTVLHSLLMLTYALPVKVWTVGKFRPKLTNM